ncbi:MAG: PmoA family protein [Chloroflexota bacterium]|nr:PmoA family protein [Chloroflexota bacterium]
MGASAAAVLGSGPVGQESAGGACLLRQEGASERGGDAEGEAGDVVAQYDPLREELAFVVPGRIAAGSRRRFTLVADGSAARNGTALRAAPFPVALQQKLDRVVFRIAGEAFGTYNVLGGRRPYFWPLLGPSGASVIRGQGTGEHPHHTGLGLSYGGHSEGGSSNIWSDWDEPPYGPGGRMLHRGFRRLTGGPVYGEVVQDLTYVDAYGDPIVDEVRTIRCWWASHGARYLDFHFHVLSARDRGPQPFLFMMRLPGFFDVPNTGRVTNAIDRQVPLPDRHDRYYRAAWVDGSGPSGDPPAPPATAPPETLVDLPGAPRPQSGPGSGPWNGIALFDHPENDGFPGTIGKYAVVQQVTQAHYPPPSAPRGPFAFRHRVYVHDGDAAAAGVAARAAEYALPCQVDVST